MMHSNGFVIALKNANKEVLRETNNGTVYLPFYSEYSLLLKNNNDRKAQVTIKIDGTNVLGNSFIILHPNETCDLERFVLDRNLNKGNKFKFVPKNDSRVADPSNFENGDIEVTFKLEKKQDPIMLEEDWKEKYRSDFPNVQWRFGDNNTRSITPKQNVAQHISTSYERNMKYCSDNHFDANMSLFAAAIPVAQAGATVEGSQSNQSFVYGTIGELETISTILRLKILAPLDSVTTIASTISETKRKYCTECGKKLKHNDKYCNRCGKEQLHPFLVD